jgi:hypothetical protein
MTTGQRYEQVNRSSTHNCISLSHTEPALVVRQRDDLEGKPTVNYADLSHGWLRLMGQTSPNIPCSDINLVGSSPTSQLAMAKLADAQPDYTQRGRCTMAFQPLLRPLRTLLAPKQPP